MLLASGSWLIVTSLLLTLHATPGGAQGVDKTREANQGGADVVDAVVDVIRSNCIFSEDRLFLRRLAYVESRDGSPLIHTYRPGYDGGIWQVDEDKFNATLTCSSVLATYCAKIRQPPFNIEWRSVTWSDLRKPLYSGLAATFYLLQKLGSSASTMPSDIQSQSLLWSQSYRPGGNASDFESLAGKATEFDCSSPMDLAFILDSSGSISDASFNLSLDFAARVVEAMNIPDPVRVAALIFASSPFLQFNFSDTQTTAQVAAALRGIKRSTGSTATYLALDMARTSLFAAGSRSSANRVVVLVTDGESDNRNWTEVAANMLRSTDQGGGHATVFAVGVGGYNPVELMAMATEPKCLHVFTLDDFSVISSIIYEIQRSTCTAHRTIGGSATNVTVTTPNVTGRFVIPEQQATKTVMFDVQCGTLDVYVSFTNPKPSPALYTHKYTAWDGRPAYLLTSSANDGLPVYISVVGTQLPPSLAAIEQCTGFRIHIATVDRPWQVRCCNYQECRDCTKSDILQQANLFTDVFDTHSPAMTRVGGQHSRVHVLSRSPVHMDGDEHLLRITSQLKTAEVVDSHLILSGDLSFQNPCTHEALLAGKTIFPYIDDSKKYIRCDYHGNPYVTLCPRGQTFNTGSLSCDHDLPELEFRSSVPTNPCTPEQLVAHNFFFDYPPDKQQFIHCDGWGGAWIQTCPVSEIWNQELHTCVKQEPPAPDV